MKLKSIAAAAIAEALPFAHLLGLPRAEEPSTDPEKGPEPGKVGSNEDCPPKGEDETDEEYEARKSAWDKEHAKSAEEKKPDSDDNSDEDGDDEKDDEDETPEGKKARARERKRVAAIFASKAAAVRPDLAAHLATQTTMPSAGAIAMLEIAAAAVPKVRSLASRMSEERIPQVGSEGTPGKQSGDPGGAPIVAAYNKALGRKSA